MAAAKRLRCILAAGAGAGAGALSLLLAAAGSSGAVRADDELACAPPSQWVLPQSRTVITVDAVIAAMSKRTVVLLGENHDNADHHRWQLHTMAALHSYQPNIVIGMEMLPRRSQPVLDRWVAGELSPAAFLEAVEWDTVWGFDSALYLPLFHFARLHRIPMVALNVDRALISEVARKGWAGVPEEARQGISTPAPASEPYRRSLARVHLLKHQMREGERGQRPEAMAEAVPEEDFENAMREQAFQHFVEAQLTWDRAMAEVLAREARRSERPLVIGLIGLGHIENGWGVPHQLGSLGIHDTAVLLPWQRQQCGAIPPEVADAVFLFDEEDRGSASQGPRLGVKVASHPDGVQIVAISEGGVADTAGLVTDDIIVSVGGTPMHTAQDLISVIQKQMPGATLPLMINRGGTMLNVVARFPVASAQ